jgi:hypothetical protein
MECGAKNGRGIQYHQSFGYRQFPQYQYYGEQYTEVHPQEEFESQEYLAVDGEVKIGVSRSLPNLSTSTEMCEENGVKSEEESDVASVEKLESEGALADGNDVAKEEEVEHLDDVIKSEGSESGEMNGRESESEVVEDEKLEDKADDDRAITDYTLSQ